MATKDSKVERVNKDKDKGLFIGKPTALVETIATTPLVGGYDGAAVVGDIHSMESSFSKDGKQIPPIIGSFVGATIAATTPLMMELHIRKDFWGQVSLDEDRVELHAQDG